MNVILIQSAGAVGLILANSLSILLHCHCQPRHNLFLYLWYSYRIQLKLSEGYKCKKDFYDFESESLSPFLQMRSMWLIICEVLKSAFSCCILSFLTAVKIWFWELSTLQYLSSIISRFGVFYAIRAFNGYWCLDLMLYKFNFSILQGSSSFSFRSSLPSGWPILLVSGVTTLFSERIFLDRQDFWATFLIHFSVGLTCFGISSIVM